MASKSFSVVARRTRALSLADGLSYAVMVGIGEFYFVADAVRLGASPLQIALVVALPLCLGALGPLLVLPLLAHFRRRKPFVVTAAFFQALVYAALVAFDAAGVISPAILIAAVCLYQLFGQACGTVWSSWFGDLVAPEVRGRFFGRRTAAIHLATLLALVAGGVILDTLEPPVAAFEHTGGRGFQILFAGAAIARLLSALFLALTDEPRFQGFPETRRLAAYARTGHGKSAIRLLSVAAAFNFMVYIGSPYFAPYMLENLAFRYRDYMIAHALLVFVKVLLMRRWGPAIDAYGARHVYVLAVFLVALVPLPWLWATGLPLVLLAQALSGFAWAGYEVSFFSLLLDSTFPRTRLHVFAVQNLLNGTLQFLGGLFGSLILASVSGELRWVFAMSFAGRAMIAVLAPFLVPPAPRQRPIGRRDLLFRVIGFRPGGGLVHRPLVRSSAAVEE